MFFSRLTSPFFTTTSNQVTPCGKSFGKSFGSSFGDFVVFVSLDDLSSLVMSWILLLSSAVLALETVPPILVTEAASAEAAVPVAFTATLLKAPDKPSCLSGLSGALNRLPQAGCGHFICVPHNDDLNLTGFPQCGQRQVTWSVGIAAPRAMKVRHQSN
nr:hypothetical protein [uncultured bacterium]